jgi:hypothetical protein
MGDAGFCVSRKICPSQILPARSRATTRCRDGSTYLGAAYSVVERRLRSKFTRVDSVSGDASNVITSRAGAYSVGSGT